MIDDVVTVTPETIAGIVIKRFGGGDPGGGLHLTCHEAHMLVAKLTRADGNQLPSGLRGDPAVARTSGDDTRDTSLAFSRAEAAEQQVKEQVSSNGQL